MKRWALLFCLLPAACAAPPPKSSDPRASWQEKTRAIRNSWTRTELQAFLDSIRVPDPQQQILLDGGGFGAGSGPMTYFNLYSLDDTFALYVIWENPGARQGIRSTEVV